MPEDETPGQGGDTDPFDSGRQEGLFAEDPSETWRAHWRGMPEFVQEDLTPWKTIYVHFERREDLEAFASVVGQRINLSTRSIWYPEAEIGRFAGKRYVDSEPEAGDGPESDPELGAVDADETPITADPDEAWWDF